MDNISLTLTESTLSPCRLSAQLPFSRICTQVFGIPFPKNTSYVSMQKAEGDWKVEKPINHMMLLVGSHQQCIWEGRVLTNKYSHSVSPTKALLKMISFSPSEICLVPWRVHCLNTARMNSCKPCNKNKITKGSLSCIPCHAPIDSILCGPPGQIVRSKSRWQQASTLLEGGRCKQVRQDFFEELTPCPSLFEFDWNPTKDLISGQKQWSKDRRKAKWPLNTGWKTILIWKG